MERLSALDATFLYGEAPEMPMHVAILAIVEPSVGTENRFKWFQNRMKSVLHNVPFLYRHAEMSSVQLDHPVWVEDGEVDLDYHVKHTALPNPGSMEQLRTLVARLHMILLDRTKPLWQFYLIEGLENGRCALYLKMHHAAIDGGAGNAAFEMFFSEREGLGPSVLPGAASSQKGSPNFLELLSGSYENFFRQQQELLKSLPDIGNAIGSLFTRMLSNLSKGEMEPLIAPKTILNVSVSNERCCGLCTVPFQDVKTISKAASAKINDVVLAICAGALRRYLEARNALPEESLLVAVPASLRDPGNTDMNNQVTIMRCSLHTNIADPIDRLESIKKSTSDSKALLGEIKGALVTDFSWLGAPIILTSMSQLISRTKAADQLPALVNLAISNVPGPRSDLCFAGARITHNYPISIAGHGAVLNITVHSYLDQLDFGTIACRRAVPDVQTINDLIVEETAALLNAARAGTNGR